MNRSYEIDTPLGHALDLLGERWTLLILCLLLDKPRRYVELRDALPRISSNLLTMRLRRLLAAGMIEQTSIRRARAAYRLTATGMALAPAVHELERWANYHLLGERVMR